MKNYTDITVLLDRSGSMEVIQDAMESGFDEFIAQHKKVPSTRLSLIQFDGGNPQEVIYEAKPAADVPKLSLVPRGATPLLDALCTAIDNAGRRFAAMREEDRPNRVLFVVITDGQENASIKYKRSDVKDRISRQQGTYNWEFIYIGANQDAFAEAASFGISYDHAINFAYAGAGTKNVMRSLGTKTMSYAGGASTATLDWAKDEREEAMEDDSKPKGSK